MDVRVTDNGTTVSFRLETDEARDWVREHVETEGWQWMGNRTLVVDLRFAEALYMGMVEAGLTMDDSDLEVE